MNKPKEYDALLLIVDERDGIFTEYQRQLCEASLCGIEHVLFCFVCDNDNDSNRVNYMEEKLNITLDLLNMKRLSTTITVWDDFIDSRVLKINENERILTSVLGFQLFDEYKENKMDSEKENLKLLTKSVARNGVRQMINKN